MEIGVCQMYIHENAYSGRMAADVFAILADPTRRRLVEALGEGERSVNDLVGEVDVEQPGVSRHLRILHEAGFVRVRAEGQRRLYSLRPEPFEQLEAWMRRYARDELARLRRLSKLVDERPKRRK
jgi:DNA-binding transcriptional ArsR family regulator